MFIEQHRRQARHRPFAVRALDQLQALARLHHALLQHPVIPTGAPTLLNAQGHLRHVEAVVELPAGHAPLGHLQQRRPHTNPVAQADIRLAPTGGAEVLAECAGLGQQWMLAKLCRPGCIVLAGIVVDGLFHTTVDPQIPCSSPSSPSRPTASGPWRGAWQWHCASQGG